MKDVSNCTPALKTRDWLYQKDFSIF